MIGRVQVIAKGGDGIIRQNGSIVFVSGVLPGELVEFAISGRKKSVYTGTLLKVLEPSEARVAPPCPYFGICGGCNLQHARYDAQLEIKKSILIANLKKIGSMDDLQNLTVVESPPLRYRSRTVFKVRGRDIGFFKRQSHEVVAVASCLLVPQPVEDLIRFLSEKAAGEESGELSVLSNGREVAAVLRAAGRRVLLSPEPEVRFEIADNIYICNTENFIQTNLFLHAAMIELAEEQLRQKRYRSAMELFCGIGFFTLVISRFSSRVLAVENDPGNLAALKRNLEINDRTNVRILAEDGLRANLPKADCYILDPPRSGLTTGLIHRISAAAPERIIYFSCDSATFSRDAACFLKNGFRILDLRMIDNFPQTDHFEIFSVLGK